MNEEQATHQASRAEHQPGGGMEAVERDVIAVPRDKDAKRLVEAILEQAQADDGLVKGQLLYQLGMVRDNAERLAVLLGERDAAREELVTALERIERNCRWGHESINEAWNDLHTIVAIARAALARVKGGS